MRKACQRMSSFPSVKSFLILIHHQLHFRFFFFFSFFLCLSLSRARVLLSSEILLSFDCHNLDERGKEKYQKQNNRIIKIRLSIAFVHVRLFFSQLNGILLLGLTKKRCLMLLEFRRERERETVFPFVLFRFGTCCPCGWCSLQFIPLSCAHEEEEEETCFPSSSRLIHAYMNFSEMSDEIR